MSEPQLRAFIAAEADSWFRRNRDKPHYRNRRDDLLGLVERYVPKRTRTLEIGCASGPLLAALCEAVEGAGVGVDLSQQALGEARDVLPAHLFARAGAHALPFADASFGLVVFGFCLYLVDRGLLHRAVAEADRVLAEGGWLGIVDFDAAVPRRRAYKPYPGLCSYKTDYAALFLASPAYSLVAKLAAATDGGPFSRDPEERVGTWLLFKDSAAGYAPGEGQR